MKCPMCNGEGGEYTNVIYKGLGGGEYMKCDLCNGNGYVSMFLFIKYYKEIDKLGNILCKIGIHKLNYVGQLGFWKTLTKEDTRCQRCTVVSVFLKEIYDQQQGVNSG